MKTEAIREKFIQFFRDKSHTVVTSSPLIPKGDPTLLFTNAGMVQFKRVFLGEEKRKYTRAVSVQKCLRAGGKHNDLENVGYTARHHTFFEMLGNFSFGDYFKEEAIGMAWEFLTETLGLPTEKLYATAFREDDEAYKIWEAITGLPQERIVRLGEEDNFWAMGDTGPCGPCSEILIDQGEEVSCGRPTCAVGCSCDRYLEIWNLVFMQYNRDTSGKLVPLPRPSIDTGMGLERLAAVMQGVKSDYDIDCFQSLIRTIEEVTGKKYGVNEKEDLSFKVIADHSRAIAFLIADGVIPANEGGGYVLRRIIRRASRYGKMLGRNEPFLRTVAEKVVSDMAVIYPELLDMGETLSLIVEGEEERFAETLERGLSLLTEEIEKLSSKGEKVVPGDAVFKWYDTFGFPLDLTEDILREEGMTIDEEGFNRAMERQREMGREARREVGEGEYSDLMKKLTDLGITTEFVGYECEKHASKVVKIIRDSAFVEAGRQGEEIKIIVEATPFYGESGGQVGDNGLMRGKNFEGVVTDTTKPTMNIYLHHVNVKRGTVKVGDEVELYPDIQRRKATSLNHTATHILHAFLRKILGGHVKQAGSLVAPDRLRFDYNHFSSLDEETLYRIEDEINQWIRKDIEIGTNVLPFNEAVQKGAIALFGEKYGDEVRVVEVTGLSQELCGGIHARRTGEIGLFKFVSEAAISAGVRRIEAVTGEKALELVKDEERTLKEVASLLKTDPKSIKRRLEKLLENQKNLEREIGQLKREHKAQESISLLKDAKDVDGIKIISTKAESTNPGELRELADKLRNGIGSGIVLLGAVTDGKVLLLVSVTKDLTQKFHAGNIVKELAPLVDGKGGGRPDMAQAGGSNPKGLDKAIDGLYDLVKRMVA
jgi:alanyl-tRNA synthetase